MRFCKQTAQTGLFRSVSVNTVLFCAKRLEKRSFSLVMMCLMYLDGSDVKPPKNARLEANGSNRAVSKHFGEFSALSHKTCRGALFFTCYDVFDVIEWFPRETTQECTFRSERLKPGCFGAFG